MRNYEVAAAERVPVCQDSGVAVVFLEIGQDVHWVGGSLTDAMHAGIREGTQAGYLRRSVTGDPTRRLKMRRRRCAGGVVHIDIVPGDGVRLTVASKGFGAENMSALRMLVPADGVPGITDCRRRHRRTRRRQRVSAGHRRRRHWRHVRGRGAAGEEGGAP